MLEIICLGALALTSNICLSTGANLPMRNAIELNNTATEVYLAGRHYESDYTKEAERIKEHHDLQHRRNSRLRRNRVDRYYEINDGGCVDEEGRIHRNPDRECIEERETYQIRDRRYEERDRIFREPN